MKPKLPGSSRSPQPSSPEGWRTALKAAFFVGGDDGHEVFASAAGSSNRELRNTVAFSLYLFWRRDPGRVYEVFHALARRVGRFPVGRTSRMLQTLADASITIYVNHPERRELTEQTSELWNTVLKGRLRLHRRRWLEPVVFPLLSTVFSRRILETALLSQRPDVFFRATPELRACFARVAPLVDPSVELETKLVVDDLGALLESPVRLHNVLAAMTVAVRAAGDVEATEPLVRELHSSVDPHGRLWLLQAFAVPLPTTPRSWLPLVEELTRDLVERDRETFVSRDGGKLLDFDIMLLPLGLAYAKDPAVDGMPYLDEVIARSIDRHDTELLSRVLEALAPIGFHYPEVLFRSLRPVMGAVLAEPAACTVLARTLADVRTLWFDEVDLFLRGTEADLEFRREVASTTNVERMRRLVSWGGAYNNAVHQALYYPRMRRMLLLRGLRELASASSPRQFVLRYTRPVLQFLRDSDFELIRWTLPEEP